ASRLLSDIVMVVVLVVDVPWENTVKVWNIDPHLSNRFNRMTRHPQSTGRINRYFSHLIPGFVNCHPPAVCVIIGRWRNPHKDYGPGLSPTVDVQCRMAFRQDRKGLHAMRFTLSSIAASWILALSFLAVIGIWTQPSVSVSPPKTLVELTGLQQSGQHMELDRIKATAWCALASQQIAVLKLP